MGNSRFFVPAEDEAAAAAAAADDAEAEVPPKMAAEAAAAAPRSNPAGAPAADVGSMPPGAPLLFAEAWPAELSWLEAIFPASGFDSSSAASSVGRCPLVHDPVLTRPSDFKRQKYVKRPEILITRF